MKAYYNDNDKFVCEWLYHLMKQGAIPHGEIDQRSIKEVSYSDVRGFEQTHFFAGIGGWAYALKIAGWDEPCWTGSCPCQPFSSAGRRQGTADERHLWPEFRRLIEECRPPTVFGEQVESKDGRLWLSGVRSDLEELDYAVGAADLCAAGVSAPHRRQRLYFVGELGNPCDARLEKQSSNSRVSCETSYSIERQTFKRTGAWLNTEYIFCTNGKYRRVEPGTFPLAHGVPSRVGRLRGYGNAISPYVAAEFVSSFMDIRREL